MQRPVRGDSPYALLGAEAVHHRDGKGVLALDRARLLDEVLAVGPVAAVLEPRDQTLAVLDLSRQRQLLEGLGKRRRKAVGIVVVLEPRDEGEDWCGLRLRVERDALPRHARPA